jgi:hypothetical protein
MSSRAETGVDSLAQPGTMAGMSEWQPIETAPKDRDILVGWWSAGVWFVRNACWEDGFDINTGAIDPRGEGWWYPNTSVGTYKVCQENNAVDGPQYWMEMPEPPKERP